MSLGIGNLLTFFGLGILATYLSLRRGIKSPLLLWVVLLFAPLSIVGWEVLIKRPLPQFLFISIFLTCSWLYFRLARSEASALDLAYEEVLEAAIATDISSKPSLPSSSMHLAKAEEAMLKACFPLSVFYLQSIKYGNQAIVCQGQLRYKPNPRSDEIDTEAAYRLVSHNVQQKFGDRFLVLLQERNAQPQDRDAEDDTNVRVPYYFALIPQTNLDRASSQTKSHTTKSRSALAIILLLAAILTILLAATNSTLLQTDTPFDFATTIAAMPLVKASIPYLSGAIAIFACREFIRDRVAKHYQVRLSLPHFIPFIGSFGCLGALTWPQGTVPHRRALFNLAIAPSIAGLSLSLSLFIWGILQPSSVPAVMGLPSHLLAVNLLPFDLRSSILMAVVAQAVTGGRFSTGAVDMHPLGLAGCLGMAISTIGLVPLGSLEGGHLVHAMFGVRKVAIIGRISRLLLLAISLVARSWLFAFALALFLLDSDKQPALNEATDLHNWQDVLGFLLLALMVLTISPVPKFWLPLLGMT